MPRSTVEAGLLLLLGVIIFVVKTEYRWWGDVTARSLVALAGWLVPRSVRDRLRDEWLGELGAIQREQGHAGVLFGAGQVLAGFHIAAAWSARRIALTLRRVTTARATVRGGVALLVVGMVVLALKTGQVALSAAASAAGATASAAASSIGARREWRERRLLLARMAKITEAVTFEVDVGDDGQNRGC
jgi:hypothetical protein